MQRNVELSFLVSPADGRSATNQFFMECRITRPCELDLGGSCFERRNIVSGSFNVRRAEILFQPSENQCVS
jgi:hypothetical protein